jgi:hypothetical protein
VCTCVTLIRSNANVTIIYVSFQQMKADRKAVEDLDKFDEKFNYDDDDM